MDFMGGSSDNCNATTHRYHRGFFQPLSPAFLNNFSIPRWYVKHMEEELKGRPLKSIVLVRQNAPQQHHWLVQIKDDGRHFKEESWKKFAVENDLTVGDFVVFIHAANFLFRVSVFDPVTASERRPLLQVHAHPKPSPKEESKIRINDNSKLNKKWEAPAASKISARLPAFLVKLTHYYVNFSIVHIPTNFVNECGLANTTCEVILKDEKERSWAVKLSYRKSKGSSRSYICRGFKDFLVNNGLKPGNVIKFQLLKAGEYPVLKCCKMLSLQLPAASEVSARHPTCVVQLSPYSAKSSLVNLPINFVRESGLQNRTSQVILKDGKERSWPAKLCYWKCNGKSYCKLALKDFQAKNELKPGNFIRLQLLQAGEHPVLKCSRVKKSSKEMHMEDNINFGLKYQGQSQQRFGWF